METRISGNKEYKVIKKLSFDFSYWIEAKGYLGDIWVCWNWPITFTMIYNHIQFIHYKVPLET